MLTITDVLYVRVGLDFFLMGHVRRGPYRDASCMLLTDIARPVRDHSIPNLLQDFVYLLDVLKLTSKANVQPVMVREDLILQTMDIVG